jgi:hypothetical protein
MFFLRQQLICKRITKHPDLLDYDPTIDIIVVYWRFFMNLHEPVVEGFKC